MSKDIRGGAARDQPSDTWTEAPLVSVPGASRVLVRSERCLTRAGRARIVIKAQNPGEWHTQNSGGSLMFKSAPEKSQLSNASRRRSPFRRRLVAALVMFPLVALTLALAPATAT